MDKWRKKYDKARFDLYDLVQVWVARGQKEKLAERANDMGMTGADLVRWCVNRQLKYPALTIKEPQKVDKGTALGEHNSKLRGTITFQCGIEQKQAWDEIANYLGLKTAAFVRLCVCDWVRKNGGRYGVCISGKPE